jgi:hypothetical protein
MSGGDGVIENAALLLYQVLCLHPFQLQAGQWYDLDTHTVEFDLDVGSLREVVAAIHGKHLELPLYYV